MDEGGDLGDSARGKRGAPARVEGRAFTVASSAISRRCEMVENVDFCFHTKYLGGCASGDTHRLTGSAWTYALATYSTIRLSAMT